MSEAQKDCVELKDVDEGTFIRFSQWAHNGYYVTAGFNVVDVANSKAAPTPNLLGNEETSLPSDWDSFGASKKSRKAKKAYWSVEQEDEQPVARSSKDALKEAFLLHKYAVPETSNHSTSPRANLGPAEDYTEVFLSHARVYVFAEKYEIQPLKALAINQLHGTLALFTLYNERIGDIVALLRYSYANTADLEDGTKQLREMLMHYVGTEMEILIKADEFTELLEEGGALLHDFLKMVSKRLSG